MKKTLAAFLLPLFIVSSCKSAEVKLTAKSFTDANPNGSDIMINGIDFYSIGLVSEDNFIKGYADITYLESKNGFPFRYFTISNNIQYGYHFSYMAVFDMENQKRIEPICFSLKDSFEELIVYDLDNVQNFGFGRYTISTNLFYKYNDFYFNYLKFSKTINFNKYQKYEQFSIRYN